MKYNGREQNGRSYSKNKHKIIIIYEKEEVFCEVTFDNTVGVILKKNQQEVFAKNLSLTNPG